MSGPLPDALRLITRPLAWMYRRVIEARNRRYDRAGGIRVERTVISVGNITTGGTGKTPMVMWIAHLLVQHGHRPAIAMRGYGSFRATPSDEQLEYADALPDVPLLVDPDRAGAIRAGLARDPSIDLVILDDGFQHRRLHRDLDLVLVDATCDLKREAMLPAGHLREPARNLARADAVIITRAEASDSRLDRQIEHWHGRPPLAWSRHAWRGLELHRPDGSIETAAPGWLAAKRVTTLLGVGNPRAIERQLEQAGARLVAAVPARDHERYTAAQLSVARLAADGSDGLIMTWKDWVKAREVIDLSNWPVPIVVLRMEMEILEGAAALEQLILRAAECGQQRVSPITKPST